MNATTSKKETRILIGSVLIAGICSIIYELLIGAVSSYFLGDSIKQFSLVIGIYMAAMGLGSFFSRYISDENILEKFVAFEIVLGLLGGCSVPILYFSFAFTGWYTPIMIGLTTVIGICIGMEIPFLTRIMERYYTLEVNLSNVLSLDYLGALIATLLFPFVLLPFMGTFKSSLFFGIINMLIGVLILIGFSKRFRGKAKRILLLFNTSVFVLLISLMVTAETLMKNWTNNLYQDRVILAKESKYQNIVLTKDKNDLRLYLNGSLQFSASDEYRYHEALVHVSMSIKPSRNILVLGGGDGLGVRELLKYNTIETITLVDLDPMITDLAKTNPHLKEINNNSLHDPRVRVINQDAHTFLLNSHRLYDLIIADLPDPNNSSLARLYSKEFYTLISTRLDIGGMVVTQSTSPFFARKTFWSINKTMESAGFQYVYPYHVNVPSFGEWGFNIASHKDIRKEHTKVTVPTRFLTDELLQSVFIFEKDVERVEVEHSTIDNPVILEYYLQGWQHWQ